MYAFAVWKEVTLRRKRLRSMFNDLNERLVYNLKANVFISIRLVSIRNVAAVDIQRYIRGLFGRIEKYVRLILKKSATCIQSTWRGYIQRSRFNVLLVLRRYSAIEIQRVVRGTLLGRRIAKLRLLSAVQEERTKAIRLEKETHLKTMVQSAKVIQPKVKSWLTQAHENDKLQRRNREHNALQEMKLAQDKYERERSIRMKELQITDMVLQNNAANEIRNRIYNIKRSSLHRRVVSEQYSNHELKKREKLAQQIDIQRQDLIKHWIKTEEIRCQSHKELISSSLKKSIIGFSELQWKIRKDSQQLLKERLTDVLRRSKSRAMKIELDTARATAQEEVIHILVERERSQVHKDMNDALEMLDSKFITQMAELDKCENEARNKSAAATISSAAYRWYKRRNLFP